MASFRRDRPEDGPTVPGPEPRSEDNGLALSDANLRARRPARHADAEAQRTSWQKLERGLAAPRPRTALETDLNSSVWKLGSTWSMSERSAAGSSSGRTMAVTRVQSRRCLLAEGERRRCVPTRLSTRSVDPRDWISSTNGPEASRHRARAAAQGARTCSPAVSVQCAPVQDLERRKRARHGEGNRPSRCRLPDRITIDSARPQDLGSRPCDERTERTTAGSPATMLRACLSV